MSVLQINWVGILCLFMSCVCVCTIDRVGCEFHLNHLHSKDFDLKSLKQFDFKSMPKSPKAGFVDFSNT